MINSSSANNLQQHVSELELIPLGAAMNCTTRGNTTELAPALDVKHEWVSPEVAKLYKEWQDLPDQLHRMEWIAANLQTNTLVYKAYCITDPDNRIIHPRDAVAQLEQDWITKEETNLLQKAGETNDYKVKQLKYMQLAALYNKSENNVFIVDMENPPSENEKLLMRNKVPFLPRNEITAFKAKAKSCKTTAASILAAACISVKSVLFGMERPSGRTQPFKVLFADTEQSSRSSYKLNSNILRMAGYSQDKNNALLTVINLRQVSTESRLTFLLSFVSSQQYDFVILDGIKDLAKDINDNKEADEIVGALTKICSSYNVAILTILHENPTKDNDKMRGHLGTELLNKAHDVFEVTHDKSYDVYNVVNTESREKPIEAWAFHFVPDSERPGSDKLEECTPTETKTSGANGNNTKEIKEIQNWNKVIKTFEDSGNLNMSIEKNTFINDYVKSTGESKYMANKALETFVPKGWIKEDGDGEQKRYYINPKKLTEYQVNKNNASLFLEQQKKLDEAPF